MKPTESVDTTKTPNERDRTRAPSQIEKAMIGPSMPITIAALNKEEIISCMPNSYSVELVLLKMEERLCLFLINQKTDEHRD